MFADVRSFLRFAVDLFLLVMRRPKELIATIQELPVEACLKFGWLCLFLATIGSATFQSILASQMLGQFSRDSASLIEMTKLFAQLSSEPVGDLRERFEIVRLANYFSLWLSPISSWIFLYLLSGALFIFARLVSFGVPKDKAYESLIKIVAVGQAPLVLCLIPVLGPIVGNLWCIWIISRGVGELFGINVIGRLSIVAFSFLFLFSIWNSTLSILASAYHKDLQKGSKNNAAEVQQRATSSGMI